jgi:hypothetical protein
MKLSLTLSLLRSLMLMAFALLASGCSSSPDERLAQFAEQSTAQQAEQNRAMAAQTQRVAEAAESLVRADAQARESLLRASFEQQATHEARTAELDQVRALLQAERQRLADGQRRDQLTAGVLQALASNLSCLLPLLLAGYLLHVSYRSVPDDRTLNEVLLQELARSQALHLPSQLGPARLGPPASEEEA